MKTNKKGFTIVELTIVIAVIAILAAVLIPTFVSLVKKADNSADVQMVTNINKYLASIEAIDGRNETMADAMADAAEVGYTKGAFQNLSSGNTILWDEDNDRFLAINEKGKVVAGEIKSMKNEYGKYWIVYQSVNGKYATYLVGKVTNFDAIKLGLDLTEYTGDAPTITVGAENVKINGVVKALNANGKNPTVYGYVAELTGNVVSKNATFDISNKVNTKLISGDFKLEHYPDSTGRTCQFCGAELVEVPVDHVHNYELKNDKCEEANCTSIGLKWYECSCGSAKVETVDALGHSFKNYVSDDNAECEKDGTETAQCERCTETDTRTVEGNAKGHTEENVEAKAATCIEPGYKAGKRCSVCKKTLEGLEEIQSTNQHDYTVLKEAAVAATCTQTGKNAVYQCKNCDATQGGEDTGLAGHDIVTDVVAKAATCTEDGCTASQHCKNCDGQTVLSQVIPATGHKFSKSHTENYKCANCNECREKTNISGDILTEGMVLIPGDCSTTIEPNEFQAYADSIVFGFTEDYIDKIEASKNYSKYSTENDDVFIYAVKIENNRNCELDTRDHLLEIYVLSDKVMCYSGNAYLFATYGLHIVDDKSYSRYEGAVRGVRLENFDTTAATDLSNLFRYCYIENLYLGQNMIVPTGAKTENTFHDAEFATVKHENNGWTVEPGEDLLAPDATNWPSKIQKKNTEA